MKIWLFKPCFQFFHRKNTIFFQKKLAIGKNTSLVPNFLASQAQVRAIQTKSKKTTFYLQKI